MKPITDGQIRRIKRLESNNRRRAKSIPDCEAEPVDIIAVLEGQNWQCVICNDRLDPSILPSDKMSISIEHPIGLSWGGHHRPGNVYGAHLCCNLSKGKEEDTKKAAKVKRLQGLTGQAKRRAERKAKGTYIGLRSKGFNKRLTKKFDRTVVPRRKG